mmetsp:Transcript_98910/g.277902  ORF Transcript_98910/g.277902 Transcript_98910/m.277902 type:complete len:119 (+) Transcript_98910:161-517(+)
MPSGSTELETEQVLEIIRILPHELVFRPHTVPKDVKSATQRNIREPLDGSGAADRSTFDGSFQIHCGPVREVGADIVAGSLGHASQKAGTDAATSAAAADAFGGGGSAAAAAARFAST